jgi:hypothetical protein
MKRWQPARRVEACLVKRQSLQVEETISLFALVQIVQSLRTRGDMNFEEISLVIPCLEMAHDYGYQDLEKEQPGCLRAFKTHFSRKQCHFSHDAKYIYVARNPIDVRTHTLKLDTAWILPMHGRGARLSMRQASTCGGAGHLW